jgi:small subunit ribosomal protein S9
MADEPQNPEENEEQAPTPEAEAPAEEPAVPEDPAAAEEPAAPEEEPAPAAEEPAPAAEEPAPAAEEPAPAAEEQPAAPAAEEQPAAPAAEEPAPAAAEEGPETPRAKPEIPGADLEVDIVPEGYDPLSREEAEAEAYDAEGAPISSETDEEDRPVPQAAIDLAAGARYGATGKRKTAIARVVLKPGKGEYLVNGRALEAHFPRPTLQRNIRQPLETVGYESRMDVVATLHGGGVSAQAGALRHGISRALIEADPNLRGELKRRGFLTRDPRVKERKKAGLKKARKRPQFSKR